MFGAGYHILEVSSGPLHGPGETRTVYARLYRHILPLVLYRTCFALRHGEPL